MAVVGNEHGAHHVAAELFQALNDVGPTIPANATTSWVGEAMGGTDDVELDDVPEGTAPAAAMAARNAAHLAELLAGQQHPSAD